MQLNLTIIIHCRLAIRRPREVNEVVVIKGKVNVRKKYVTCISNGSFTSKLNLQPTGFRLASNSLQTGKMQLGYIGIAWLHSHQFYNQKPVGSQSVAILIWCEQAIRYFINWPVLF